MQEVYSTNASVAAEGKGYATMRQKSSTEVVESSAVCYDTLEQWARGKIQAQLQQLLEEEVTTFLGRAPLRVPRRGVIGRSACRESKRLWEVPAVHDDERDHHGPSPTRS